MNKKIAAAAIAAALSIGTLASVSTAQADNGRVKGVPSQVATVISGLVTKGTITQAQADAITAALTAAAPAKPERPAIGMGGENKAAADAVVTTTLGITAADLKAARVAGKSLAILAGDKKAALITALVNFETTEVDAAVTAGKLTATQATNIKTGLVARVTAKVESVPAPRIKGMDKMGKGKKMHGPDDDDSQTIAPKTTTSSLKKSFARPSIV
jgi:polyhydroxyalkanoate synthesis regulator phasin